MVFAGSHCCSGSGRLGYCLVEVMVTDSVVVSDVVEL